MDIRKHENTKTQKHVKNTKTRKNMNNFNLYTGTAQADLPFLEANANLHKKELYEPSPGLRAAVNVALALAQPLLLTGEPGTGKTELAHHLAYFFKLGEPLVFNAQTTSVVRDLFYRYDALAHFQFAQTQKEPLTNELVEQKFIRYEALGEAIRGGARRVVLIDEIDKAPRDLPNDVLARIEGLAFDVPEIDRKCPKPAPEHRPLIVITSNSEKNLPDAFLRRVVFYHIPFPDAAALLRIVSKKVEGYGEAELKKIIAHFEAIRDEKQVRLRKKPATAELLQWAFLLKKIGFPAEKLADLDALSEAERANLLLSYTVLAKSKEDIKALEDWL